MLNLSNYQLVLFDFDGLLVNTEELHFEAYKRMCRKYGVYLNWDFPTYCQVAHYDAHGLRERLLAEFPPLQSHDWTTLYAEKRDAMLALYAEGATHLMPGVQRVLSILEEENTKMCVCTHSPLDQIQAIRQQNPLLEKIPNWITRENYTHPKPHPECYLKALNQFAHPGDAIIGFEDTPRGLTALLATPVQAVLVTQVPYPEIPSFLAKGALHLSTFDSILYN